MMRTTIQSILFAGAVGLLALVAYDQGYHQGARSVDVTMVIRAPEPPDQEWYHSVCFGNSGQQVYIHDITFFYRTDGALDIGPNAVATK